MPSALVLGATGAVGKHILSGLLASPEYARVGEFGRRVTSFENPPEKLVQRKVPDFDKIEEVEGIKDGWDVVFIALGTTRAAAGSAEAFVKIDREYVLKAAAAARTRDHQRVIYVSSGGANPESRFLYTQSKGLTEQGLARLGYKDTIILRPGYLTQAERSEKRYIELIVSWVTGALAKISDKVEIPVTGVAAATVKLGLLGSESIPKEASPTVIDVPRKHELPAGRFTLVDNPGLLQLAGLKSK